MSNAIILDAIILIIVLIFAILSAKKGFVRSLIELVGFIAALIIAFTASTPLANIVYDKSIAPNVIKAVEDMTDTTESNVTSVVDSVWDQMPKFVTQNKFLGISKDDISEKIINFTEKELDDSLQQSSDNNATESVESDKPAEKINSTIESPSSNLAKKISETIVKPPVTKLLSALFSLILIIVLLFIVKILAKYINKLFTFSIIGTLNKTLGAVMGIIKGLAVATVFCLIIGLVLSLTENGFLVFTPDSIDSTIIFKLLMNFSPLK